MDFLITKTDRKVYSLRYKTIKKWKNQKINKEVTRNNKRKTIIKTRIRQEENDY